MIREGSISEASYNQSIRRIRLICSESIDELSQFDELFKDERFYDDKVDEVE